MVATKWSHTDAAHDRLTYRWKSFGKGKPRCAIIMGHVKVTAHNWEVVSMDELLKVWEENKDRFIGTPHLVIETDYNYGDDEHYIVIDGEFYANEAETAQIRLYEESVKQANKKAIDDKREKDRAEYERLKKIFGPENPVYPFGELPDA